MPGYRSPGSGLYGSGVAAPRGPQVDIGQIIDAVGSGTGSILHAIMLRKQVENEAKTRQAELGLRQQQQAREDANQQFEHDFKNRDLEQRTRAQERQDLINGVVPAHDETTPVAGQSPMTPIAPVSPIRSAMRAGQMPGVQVTPSNAAAGAGPSDAVNANAAPATSATSVTSYIPETTHVPATVDLSKNLQYAKAVDVANARATAAETRATTHEASAAKLQKVRLDAQQAGREYSAKMASQRQQAALAAKSAGPIKGAMTKGQEDKKNVDAALGFLSAHAGGTYDDALETFTNSEQGKALQSTGITEDHLLRAYGKMKRDPATGQILGLMNSGAAKDAADAGVKLRGARDAARQAEKPPFKAEEPPVSPKKLIAPGSDKGPETKGTEPGAAPRAAATAWRAANPRAKGETDDQYYARYAKANP